LSFRAGFSPRGICSSEARELPVGSQRSRESGKQEMESLPKIVRQRLQATAKAELHPDPDLLTAFVEKSLNERERATVLQHLGQCADCRSVVSLATPEIVVPSTIPARSSWLSWPVLRWGALAACVVVVGAAVTLHYEGRQGAEPAVAEKAPAPTPADTLRLETQVSKEAGQKLAEKIAPASPASPFHSDRDFGAANKPARQRERAEAGSAGSASMVNRLATGRLENHPLENNLEGTDQRRSDQLTDNRLAKSDALKSSDKPSAPVGGQLAGAAPASPLAANSASANSASAKSSAANSKTAGAEEQTKQQNENLDYASGISETVTVQAEAPPVETAQAAVARGKDESDKKVQSNSGAGRVVVPRVSRNTHDLSNVTQSTPRWTISADGALQRSFDSGKSWQTIPVANHAVFRALAANDSDIWVGGAAGALYHSSDAGQSWTQIKPVAEGTSLTADVLRVEFADARHGSLTTGNHEIWITSDGGASWQRR
jgi:Photosynthesis system II assembly factor YCF48